jgi:eukaryotic-like serine/threonine-protein kinase
MLASRYRLVRLLGRGGMGEVYEGIDGVLGRRVAVKVFSGETDLGTSRARQRLEIQALARLQDPNIVAVFDAGTDAGISFVVMQLIDGVTLAERARASALPPSRPRGSAGRSQMHWPTSMPSGWCTGTSSRAIFCVVRTAQSSSLTSESSGLSAIRG